MGEKRFVVTLMLAFVVVCGLLAESIPAQTRDIRSLADMYRAREAEDEEATVRRTRPQAVTDERTPLKRETEIPTEGVTQPLDRVIDRTTYRLGPGDVVSFGIWGSINTFERVVVTPEGQLIIPSVGPVVVAGMTLEEAERHVEEVAAESYGNARLTLSLLDLRKFRVHVTGRVKQPGTYTATAADRISDLIERAGGVEDEGSQRRIDVRHANGDVTPVDLALFLTAGDIEVNPAAEMGDVIRVPVKSDSVGIWGAVGDPGVYEYRPGDSLSRLLQIAGNVDSQAATGEIEWTSFPGGGTSPNMRTVELSRVLNTPLDQSVRPGDQILVKTNTSWRERQTVEVRGEVLSPGTFTIVPGETRLSDVIRRAGGFTPEASPRASYVVRADFETDEIPDLEYKRLADVPQASMKDEEYIYFRTRSRQMFGVVDTDIAVALTEPGGPADVILRGGDVIRIEQQPVSVEVLGQVERPGMVKYEPGMSYQQYIDQAGGLSWHARKRGIRLIKTSTGVWVKPDRDTVVEAGDIVFVPQREPIDYWALAKDVIGVTTQVLTVYLLIATR